MTAVGSESKIYPVVLYWSLYRGILHTKPENLQNVLRVVGRDDTMSMLVCNYIYNQLRISPEGALDILYNFALRSGKSQIRNAAIDRANIAGRIAPEKVLELYEKILPRPEYQDSRLRLGVTHSFRNFLESSSQGNRARKNLERRFSKPANRIGEDSSPCTLATRRNN